MQGPKRLCFLAGLMKYLNTELETSGERKSFVSGSEELRLKPGIWIELIAISLILMELQILRSCCTILVEVKSEFQKTYFNEYETNFVSAAAFGVQTSRCVWITEYLSCLCSLVGCKRNLISQTWNKTMLSKKIHFN